MKNTMDVVDCFGSRLAERDPKASKADFGKLLIIGGSFGMAGAAYLSGLAAFRSGIGMVRFFGPECNRQILQTLLPEAMYTSDRFAAEEEPAIDIDSLDKAICWADHVICGPGLSQTGYAKALVRHLLGKDISDKKLVLLDADALNIVSSEKFNLKQLSLDRSRKGQSNNLVITPHMGEMSRLTGKEIREIKKTPVKTAAEFAQNNHCTVVLKDAVTYISTPGGESYRNTSGSSALAKAGSGDVLTGVIAGVTAVIGGSAECGAIIGTYIHGKAGEMAGLNLGVHSVLARDVADAVAGVLGKMVEGGKKDGKSL